ncbi:TPA: DUF859 family phage minor structural protein [Streptococcus suis]
MAKFSGASGSLYLNFYLDRSGEPDIANNRSNVAWRVTVSRTGAYYTYNEDGSSTLSVDVNGTRVNTSNPRWHTSGEEFTLASGTTTIGHNADGTKTISASATFNPNNGVHGVITVSGNISLPTIPRSSSVASVSGTIGSSVSINITRQATSFTHTVSYEFGNKSGTIATGVGTSATWTIPMDFCDNLPNTTSGKGTIYVDTYSGSTKIGTASNTLTASVPTSVKPTFTGITITDTNTAVQALIMGNNYLQIMSNIQVTFNGASGSYSSSITGYKAEIVDRNQATNSNGGTLGIMNFNGSATIRASVVDSRGRWSDTKDITINVIEYFAPILSFTALRTREDTSIIQVVRNAKIAPITLSSSQKNTMTLSFKVAPLGSTSYTADNGSASGSWTTIASLTNSPANLAEDYPSNQSFTIVGTLSDKFTSVEFSTTISTEAVVMSYDKDGRMAVGKIVDTTLPVGSFEAVGNIYASDMFIAGKALRDIFYPVGSIYQSTVNTNPSTLMGGTWERFGNGRVLVGVDEEDSDFNTSIKTGGEKAHKLTDVEMAHSHIQTERFDSAYSIGNGNKFTIGESVASDTIKTSGVVDVTNQAHNNLQPYITVYMWRRTA